MRRSRMNKFFLCGIFLYCIALNPLKAQQIAVKTNLISDMALVPCLGTELVVGEKTSLNVEFVGTVDKPWGLDLNMVMGSMQYRYWVAQRTMTQLFFGAGVKAGTYTYCNAKEQCGGDMAMLEMVAGYAWPLSKRWNIELQYGWGALVRYMFQYPVDDRQRVSTGLRYDIVTTSIGVNIVCILK